MPSIEGNIDNVMTTNVVIGSGICHHSTGMIIITVTSLPRRSDRFYGGGGNNVIRIGGKKSSLLQTFFNVFPLGFLSQHFHAGISFVFGQMSVHFKCI